MMRHALAGTYAPTEMAAGVAGSERTPGDTRDHRVQRVAQRYNNGVELVGVQLFKVGCKRQDRVVL